MNLILANIIRERERQDDLWGKATERDYTPEKWLAVLVEEVGEVAKSIQDGEVENLKEELTQVAAVAIAFLETLPNKEPRMKRAHWQEPWGININEGKD